MKLRVESSKLAPNGWWSVRVIGRLGIVHTVTLYASSRREAEELGLASYEERS